jgi:hypothetical protein
MKPKQGRQARSIDALASNAIIFVAATNRTNIHNKIGSMHQCWTRSFNRDALMKRYDKI